MIRIAITAAACHGIPRRCPRAAPLWPIGTANIHIKTAVLDRGAKAEAPARAGEGYSHVILMLVGPWRGGPA